MMLDLDDARQLFRALERTTYFNTSAVGLGNTRLKEALDAFTSDWMENGFNFISAEASGEECRALVSRILCADASDIALVPSVSAAAGLVAVQFKSAATGENIVVGALEYSSNQFPWRQLESRGYEIRQVPFRNGGLEADEIALHSDGGTRLIAASAIQTATGHRTDVGAVSEIAKRSGAWFFLDGSQSVGSVPVAKDVGCVDFLATSDHKFLLNAARGMGYLYVKKDRQKELVPFNAGWSAGSIPFESFFGPDMHLSQTASRFDNSKAWLSAIGNKVCLELLHDVGIESVFDRNVKLGEMLRTSLADQQINTMEMPSENRSHIVSVPLEGRSPDRVLATLKQRGVQASIRDGQLRLAPHFYNNSDDVLTCSHAVSEAFG